MVKMTFPKIGNDLFNHLLFIHVTAYTLGIWLSSQYILPTWQVLRFGIIPSLLLALSVLIFQKNRYRIVAASLLLFAVAGYYHGLVSSEAPGKSNHLYHRITGSEEVVITGQLQAMPAYDGSTSKIMLSVSAMQQRGETGLSKTTGNALLKMQFPWPSEILPGNTVAIRATLYPPSSFNTPGAFNYPAYLARNGIWVTGVVRSPAQITSLHHKPAIGEVIAYFPEQVRTRIGNTLDSILPAEHSGLYRALLLGDRSRIRPEVLETFKRSGTMHILAISGIHMSLIAILLFTLFYWTLRRSTWLILRTNTRKVAGILCLPPLIFYALLAGLNTPVLRACLISCFVILAFCMDRPKTFSSLLSLAVLLLLAANPQSLFTVSFQLTFAAFGSIALIIPALKKRHHTATTNLSIQEKGVLKVLSWIGSGLIVSSVAVLGTAPILIFHFHRLSPYGPLANLLIEPLICLWALPFGFLALPFLLIFPDLAFLLLKTGGYGLQLGLAMAKLFAWLPHSSLWLAPPSTPLILFYYIFFASLLSAYQHSGTRLFLRVSATCLFAICLAALLFPPIVPAHRHHRGMATIHFLDVGQGSATLVEFADGKTVLIDGGGPALNVDSIGHSVIAPFLWQHGIYRLHAIIVTHPDSDHYNGVPFLLEHFTPDTLWSSTQDTDSPSYLSLLQRAEEFHVEVKVPKEGEQLFPVGDSAGLSIMSIANLNDQDHLSSNDNGLVISLTSDGPERKTGLAGTTFQILFPGDISDTREVQLIEAGVLSEQTILLASHHGSAGSNDQTFLRHISPEYIIASAGRSQSGCFPSQRLEEYCLRHHIPLLVTAHHGTIKVTIDNGRYEVWVTEKTKNPLRQSRNELRLQRVMFNQNHKDYAAEGITLR